MSELTETILNTIKESKRAKSKQWPVKSNRAYTIGHKCARKLTYDRLHWREALLPDEILQMIFQDGHAHEALVLGDLKQAGFQVLEQQRPYEWKQYSITGHIDGTIVLNGSSYPIEIKSMSPFAFNKINTFDDLKNAKETWTHGIPGQILIYLLMSSKERGYLILKAKAATGDFPLKIIEVNLYEDGNLEYAEDILKKIETVNQFVEKNKLPDRIEYDEKICDYCPFRHVCLPGSLKKEPELEADDSKLVYLLEEYERLKANADRYKGVYDEIKEIAKNRPQILAGDWMVEGGEIQSTKYNIPDEIKKHYAQKYSYWKIKKIVKLS